MQNRHAARYHAFIADLREQLSENDRCKETLPLPAPTLPPCRPL